MGRETCRSSFFVAMHPERAASGKSCRNSRKISVMKKLSGQDRPAVE